MIDYNLRNKNIDVVENTKALIQIRKDHACFRLRTRKECKDNVYFSTIEDEALVYNTRKEMDHCIVFFNPSLNHHEYKLDRNVKILFDNGNCNESKTNLVQIAPVSVVVCGFEY